MVRHDHDSPTTAPQTKRGAGVYAPVERLSPDAAGSLRESLSNPISIIRVQGDLFIEMAAIVSDHDETISIGTGEHVHDGYLARFAQGLSLLLVELDQESGRRILSDAQRRRYVEAGSIFTEDDWAPFRGQSGKSEDAVINGMLEVARERFRLAAFGKSLAASDLKNRVDLVLECGFHALMEKVEVDEGITSLFKEAQASGIPIAVCSASQKEFVEKALAHMGVQHLVHSIVGNARKKTGVNSFDGRDIRQACLDIGVDPSQAVMFGDSIGDVGAAALAGIGVVVICARHQERGAAPDAAEAAVLGAVDAAESHPNCPFTNQVNSFQDQSHYHRELMGHGHPITVLLVDDFSQVKLLRKLAGHTERASYSLVH